MLYANYPSDTGRVNLKEVIPRVVQDLRACDLIKQENQVLRGYNSHLKELNACTQEQNKSLAADLSKSQKKGRRKNRVILIETFVIIGGIVIKVLI